MSTINIKQYLHNTYEYVEGINNGKPSNWMLFKYNICYLWNYFLYGTSKVDYFSFRFWEKSRKEKLEYATWNTGNKLLYLADTKKIICSSSEKSIMYNRLGKFVKRKQISLKNCTKDSFINFVNSVPKFIYKPESGLCGMGIQLIDSNQENVEHLYNKLKNMGGMLDEPVKQHHIINAINPSSVNTVRIFTVKIEDTVYFMGACLRIGMGDIIDNFCAGGIAVSIDIKTGITSSFAENHIGTKFYKHPITGFVLKNIQIPNWDKVIELVFNMACSYTPNYVAWDVAVRENDAVLIEANKNGGVFVIQIGDVKGRKKEYEELCRKLEKAHYPRYDVPKPTKIVFY